MLALVALEVRAQRPGSHSMRPLRLVVSGGASRIEGVAAMLQSRFGVEVEELNPFKTIAWDAARLGVDASEAAPVAAVAVGLGLRTAGDR